MAHLGCSLVVSRETDTNLSGHFNFSFDFIPRGLGFGHYNGKKVGKFFPGIREE